MHDSREKLAELRDRMVVGRALVREIHELALGAPPGLADQLEGLAVAAAGLVQKNFELVTTLLADEALQQQAA